MPWQRGILKIVAIEYKTTTRNWDKVREGKNKRGRKYNPENDNDYWPLSFVFLLHRELVLERTNFLQQKYLPQSTEPSSSFPWGGDGLLYFFTGGSAEERSPGR